MDFDGQVLPRTGGFGRFSRLLAAALWAPNVALALGFFSELLYCEEPEHRCRSDPSLRNLSGPELLLDTAGWSRCQQSNDSGSCTRGWEYESSAGLRSNIVSQWDLVCKKRWKISLELVSYMASWLGGFVVFGCACDRLGRRPVFVFSLVLVILAGVGVAVSLDYIMFLLIRGLYGSALAGTFLSLYITRLEICDPAHRLMVTMIAHLFWVAGELLLPGLAALSKEWRILQGVITTSQALLLVYWGCQSLFPESARWLLATHQLDRAKKQLRFFAEANAVNLDGEMYGEEHLFTEMDSMAEGPVQARYHSVCHLFHTRIVWKNSLILGFSACIGTGIRHSYLQNLQGYGPPFYFVYFLMAATEAASCLFLYATVNRFGRRAILLLCTILTGVSSLLLLALTEYLFPGIALAISILGILASHAVVMLSVFFASEVLPTVIRGSGLGLILAASFVGRAAAPIMDLHNRKGFFLHHVIFSSFAILSVLSIMLLPESKRKSLPESLRDGESLRRPPLFLSRAKDDLPLLSSARTAHSDYNPENYSRLMTATKKMLSKDPPPYQADRLQGEENQALTLDT
uniref:Solute carrier family 22 member 31 isoform X2 n=1 Tax=Geotrypetes seraphini TaxID=260995 RepID=A0A6P8QS69_GEOSA|nr:putative solute carrier family 22 member 31 isoform X2 [Geotrypetes seraphini]XP_033798747.1 putative solute carrier family 22 member 31 isoform X2 [Geotrypetes seraphini]